MPKMALTHNQINRMWYRPTYDKFKKHGFVKYIFTSKDAEDFLRTGAYLIKEAEKYSNNIIPWNKSIRHEILLQPRLGNIFFALGSEYFLKGIFLVKGFSINKQKSLSTLIKHPIQLKGNKGKLINNEVYDLFYIIDHIGKLIDFGEFDKSQVEEERNQKSKLKGIIFKGITRMTIPYPTAKELLTYIHFKRNYSLHRPFILAEFRGITQQLFKLLDYISQKGTRKTIAEWGKLQDISKLILNFS